MAVLKIDNFQDPEVLRFKHIPQFLQSREDKHNILFYRTDMDLQNYEDYNFILLIIAAHNLGHKVYVIANTFNPIVSTILPKSIFTYKVGSFFSLGNLNKFSSILRAFRIFYANIWILFHKYSLKPSLIITDELNSAIPILKIFGSIPVVQIYNFTKRQMVERMFMRYESISNRYFKLRIDCTDEIIVQNMISKDILNDCFKNIDHKIKILYPCFEAPLFEQSPMKKLSDYSQIPEGSYIFVQFEAQRLESNFELTVKAFMMLLKEVRNYAAIYNNLYLVIVGRYENYDMDQAYLKRVDKILDNHDFGRYCVIFSSHSQIQFRKILLSKCIAVIQPSLYDINPRPFLEAGLMKKPVIAPNAGIAKELIVDGENGYFSDQVPNEYSSHMYKLLFHDDIYVESCRKTYLYFKKNYGFKHLEREMQNIIQRNAFKQKYYKLF